MSVPPRVENAVHGCAAHVGWRLRPTEVDDLIFRGFAPEFGAQPRSHQCQPEGQALPHIGRQRRSRTAFYTVYSARWFFAVSIYAELFPGNVRALLTFCAFHPLRRVEEGIKMASKARVLIIGGGFAGLFTGLELAGHADVTLLSEEDRFTFRPLLYEYLSGEVEEWHIAPPYQELIDERINFVKGRAARSGSFSAKSDPG